MRALALLCKQNNTSLSELSKTIGVPERTIRDYFTTGLAPYILVHKIAQALGTSINEVVQESTVAEWEELYTKRVWSRKRKGEKTEKTEGPKGGGFNYFSEDAEIATKFIKPTPPIQTSPDPITPVTAAPKPKPIPPAPRKKPTVEELLKEVEMEEELDLTALTALQQEEAPKQPADMTALKVPDDFFSVSMGDKL